MAVVDRISLYPFQKEGIAFAARREASLIADDMGLGKSAQAVGVINEDASIRRVLIVCSASVRNPVATGALQVTLFLGLTATVAHYGSFEGQNNFSLPKLPYDDFQHLGGSVCPGMPSRSGKNGALQSCVPRARWRLARGA